MVHDASMLAFGYRRYRLRCMNKYDMGSWLQALSNGRHATMQMDDRCTITSQMQTMSVQSPGLQDANATTSDTLAAAAATAAAAAAARVLKRPWTKVPRAPRTLCARGAVQAVL